MNAMASKRSEVTLEKKIGVKAGKVTKVGSGDH